MPASRFFLWQRSKVVPEIKLESLLMFGAFVLPGAISMYFYGLKVPQRDGRLQEKLLEAVCFSILNFVILLWPIRMVFDQSFVSMYPISAWLLSIFCFVIAPIFWPFGLVKALEFAAKKDWILIQARNSWDSFFHRQRRGCWVIVLLNDNSFIGGKFSQNSFASSYPDSGHIFIEELWLVNDQAQFVEKIGGSRGAILRPTDYKYITVITD